MFKLTQHQQEIWTAFVNDYGIRCSANFIERQQNCEGVPYEDGTMLQEDVLNLPEWFGFTDGYDHNTEKFRGARGTPDKKSEVVRMLQDITVRIDDLQEIYKDDLGAELTDSLSTNSGKNDFEGRYHEGYVRGSACSPS